MSKQTSGHLSTVLKKNQDELLNGWLGGMFSRFVRRDKVAENEIREQASRFIPVLAKAVEKGQSYDIDSEAWEDTRDLLSEISMSRVRQGFTPAETATF